MIQLLIFLWLSVLIGLLLFCSLLLFVGQFPERNKRLAISASNSQRALQSPIQYCLWLVIALLAAVGTAALIFSFQSYESQIYLVDLLAPDGDADRYTKGAYFNLNSWIKTGGLVWMALSAGLLLFRKQITSLQIRLGRSLGHFWQSLNQDHRAFWRSLHILKDDKQYLLVLLLLFVLSTLLRLYYLNQPMRSDEAHTFVVYSLGGMETTLLDFAKPNNHVFHSLLILMSTRLLGEQPWMIRVPALLAGVLLIQGTYLAGRLFYSKDVALLSAGLVAVSSALVEYSTNARGYSLLVLFTLILFSLAEYQRRHRNRFAWCLFVL